MLGVFDIVGPVMIGPSSSHTAGAVRLGRLIREILGSEPVKAKVFLHGSFAQTGKGHGTDLALIAGLLGMKTHDERIIKAKEIAKEKGFEVTFGTIDLGLVNPNTAKIKVEDAEGKIIAVTGSSVGGGKVLVTQINDFDVHLTGELHTVCVLYKDRLGMVARVSDLLAEGNINIARMQVSREDKSDTSLMVVETDNSIPADIVNSICNFTDIDTAFILEPILD